MTVRLTGFAGVLMALLMVSGAQAATIFAQTPAVNTGFASDPNAAFYQADDFNLASADTVTNVTWRGLYASANTPSATDDFKINFYTNTSGNPGTLLQSFTVGNAVTRVDTGLDAAGSDVYEYVADLGPGQVLSGSTDYWVSIFNDTTGDTDDNWFWALDSDGIGNSSRSPDLSDWQTLATNEFYFVLGNTVPVPAAVWLFGSALGLLGWLKRRS